MTSTVQSSAAPAAPAAAATPATPATSASKTPADFLKTVLGRPVVVKLNTGVEFRGVLACLDGYMNIAMEQTEEFVDGSKIATHGDAFIRGNNGQARLLPKIFKEDQGASEQKGERARMSAYLGAIAVGDLVKTTLGPKGMDKILQSMSTEVQKTVTVTNDGATILKSIPIENPAAKILVDTSKTQDSEVGDGTTSVCVLAAELLREAEKLVLNEKLHPQTIIAGWRKAVVVARDALQAVSVDNSADPVKFREDLVNIAATTLSSKILNVDKGFFAELATDAVLRLKGSTDLGSIQIIKIVGGDLADSYLADGFILNKQIGVGQLKRVENARILVANTPMDTDKIKIYGARVRVDSMSKVADIEQAEKHKMKEKVDKILAHKVNVFINRQLIYNYPEQMFTSAGVMSIEHADFEGIERLALVTGAEIASTFDHPELATLGECKLIEEVVIGETRVIKFSGVPKGEACTVVLRGSSQAVLDEAERSLHDALCVLSQTTRNAGTVWGGGCSEMLMSNVVDDLARETPGKEALAIEGFARALRQLPTILANNGGYDSNELVAQLRAEHNKGNASMGLNLYEGKVDDMRVLKVTEALKSKMQVLISAHDAAEMILRVDDIITTAPRQRGSDHH